jgi:hypothetical protein
MNDAVSVYQSVKQFARERAVSQHTVLGWIRSGELRATNCAGRRGGRPRWKISPKAASDFEELRAARAPVATVRRRRRDLAVIEFYK